MKSAACASSSVARIKMNGANSRKHLFQRFGLIVFLLMTSNLGFSQQKTLNASQLQQDLSQVIVSIEKIDQKIAHINSRLEGIPLENIDPQLMTRLDDLEIKKDQLEKRKVSIQAALNEAQNASDPNDAPSEFESINEKSL